MKNIELELTNGKRVLISIDLHKVYGIQECFRHKIHFKPRFPFFSCYKVPYVQFRYRTTYNFTDSFTDTKYKVNCDLASFCKLLGVEYRSFAETIMRSAIEGN